MNKSLFLALTLGAFALLSSCSGDTIEADGSNPIETKAKLTLVLQNSVSGETVDGADVTLMSTGTKKTSQSGGIVVFEDVRTGEHQIRIDAGNGYAEIFHSTSVGEATNQGVYITKDTSIQVQLYPLTASVIGYLYYQDKDGNNNPAVGTVVKLQLSSPQFVNRIESATTVAGGKYEFNNLPVGAGYSLASTETTIGGIVYNPASICSGCTSLTANGTANIDIKYLTLSNTQSLFVVESYNNVIENADRSKAVEFSFSAEIDASQFRNNMVSVSEINGGELAANVSASGKKLTVAPIGTWKNSFRVYLNGLKSTNGKSLDNEDYLVNVRLRDLTDVPVEVTNTTDSTDYGDNSVVLEWERIDGADSYDIYRKIDGLDQGAYERIDYNISNPHTGTNLIKQSVLLSKGGSIQNSKVSFLVQAVNATSKTELSEENAIIVQDNVAPTVTPKPTGTDSVVYVYNKLGAPSAGTYNVGDESFDLGGTTLIEALRKGDANENFGCVEIRFSEPIDTTETIDGKFGSDIARLSVKPKWETCEGAQINTRISLHLSTSAGSIADMTVDTRYTISGLKDLSGNQLKIEYPGASGKPSKNTADVRFKFTTAQ